MRGVKRRSGVPASEMKADKTAVNVTMEVAGTPATVVAQGASQGQAAGNVSSPRHLELPAELQLAAHPGIGEWPQLTGVQPVGERGAADGLGQFAIGAADTAISLNP